MNQGIALIDRGRGLQLSTSRITVQDLVPYFQQGCANEEIRLWIPILTDVEIDLVKQYYREHKETLDEEDRCIRAYHEEQARVQRLRYPRFQGTQEELIAELRKRIRRRQQEANGEGHPG